MEKFGFVGLPNAGKSSLYNALTGGSALAAPYAFATTDPNIGVAKVPDHRLDLLTAMSESKSSVPASVQFTDIGGLVEGASKGEGLGNQFLANIREVDAIVYVLRAFEDEDVPGTSDPLEQLRVLEIELTLADLEAVEKHATKRIKAARLDKSLTDEVDALEEALETLGEGTPLYRGDFSKDKLALLSPYFLLTSKPVMAIVNVGEDQIADQTPIQKISTELGNDSDVIGVCCSKVSSNSLIHLGPFSPLSCAGIAIENSDIKIPPTIHIDVFRIPLFCTILSIEVFQRCFNKVFHLHIKLNIRIMMITENFRVGIDTNQGTFVTQIVAPDINFR